MFSYIAWVESRSERHEADDKDAGLDQVEDIGLRVTIVPRQQSSETQEPGPEVPKRGTECSKKTPPQTRVGQHQN